MLRRSGIVLFLCLYSYMLYYATGAPLLDEPQERAAPPAKELATQERAAAPAKESAAPTPPAGNFLSNLNSSGDPLKDLQNWFSGLSGNSDSNNPFSSILGNSGQTPMMILGTYQALKMPMPGMSDIMKNLGNMAQTAQGLNQMLGGLGNVGNLVNGGNGNNAQG